MTLTKELIERISESKRSDVETNGIPPPGVVCTCRSCEIQRLLENTYLHTNVAESILDSLLMSETHDRAVLRILGAIALGGEFAEQVYEANELEKLTNVPEEQTRP